MAPPRPPWFVDMRFTASRAAQETAEDIDREDRCRSAVAKSAKRLLRPTTPALLTSPSSRPNRRSVSAKSRSTSASSATSAWTATAPPPAFSMSRTTDSAAAPLGGVVDDHAIAGLAGGPGRGGADAAAGAGDENDLVHG